MSGKLFTNLEQKDNSGLKLTAILSFFILFAAIIIFSSRGNNQLTDGPSLVVSEASAPIYLRDGDVELVAKMVDDRLWEYTIYATLPSFCYYVENTAEFVDKNEQIVNVKVKIKEPDPSLNCPAGEKNVEDSEYVRGDENLEFILEVETKSYLE